MNGTGIYSMKLYPVLPVIFILAYVFIGIMIAVSDPQYAVTGIATLAAFLIIYFVVKLLKKKR